MAGTQEIRLNRKDHLAGFRVERLGLEPMTVGFDRLGQGLVEPLQRPGKRRFQFENTVDGDATQMPGFHGIRIILQCPRSLGIHGGRAKIHLPVSVSTPLLQLPRSLNGAN